MVSQTLVELSFPIAAHYHGTVPLATRVRVAGTRVRAQEVDDPELQDKLTPRYAMGCKRPSFHNEYLATFNRANVTLETDPIERITATAIVTAGGVEHPVDVLVLATGFKVFDPGNFPKYQVTGRGGVDLERWWAENRYQAYEGVSVPGFPNYFTMFGPYGYNGSSYFNLIETQTRHIVRCLSARPLDRRDVGRGQGGGQRPLLRRDASPSRTAGLLAGELLARQQLLLRPARRRPAPAEPDARDDVAQPALPARATTGSDGVGSDGGGW